MKVAIDARLIGGKSTGDSTYWTCFLEALVKNHSDVELLLISNQAKPTNVPFLEKISWIHTPAKSDRWWSMVTLPLLARKMGADILHGQYGMSPLSKNAVATIHDVSFMIDPSWFSQRDQTLLQVGARMSSKVAKRVITVSETSKTEVIRYFPAAKDKTRVAYNACPPWIQPVAADSVPGVLSKLGIKTDYVLTVGTNWARKNMRLIVEAMEKITEEQNVRLVVTGKQGAEFSAAHIIPTGYVDTETLSALYSGAKMYLAPSLHEGFGIPILEAMRCGAPVMCGPGGAMPEVAGTAGFVMPDYDPKTWEKAIGKLLRDPSKLSELSMNGRDREKEFSWDRSAQSHYEVYREIV